MKKKFTILLAALLLLCGCVKPEEPVKMIQPVTFYYKTANTDFYSEDGVIRAEVQDLGEGSFTDLQIINKYFEGPVSEDLVSPISPDISISNVFRSGSRLNITLKQDVNPPAELDHTLTYACLVKTGLALDGILEVRLYIKSPGGQKISDKVYTAGNFLLYDNVEKLNTVDVTLYYADDSGTLLVPEKRTLPLMSDKKLVTEVLKQLCSTPQTASIQPSLQPGTVLTEDIKLKDGVCTVDFIHPDEDYDRPDAADGAVRQEQAQRLQIMSVVNTLCKLDCVSQVQIYVYGSQVEPGEDSAYQFLDLSEPWTADSSVIGPIREELGEFAGTICLPGQRDGLLHRQIVRARATGGMSREEALLQMLFARTNQNGLSVPFSDTPSIVSLSMDDAVCTVSLGTGTLPLEESRRTLAIRSIAATLASLPEVGSVQILENEVSVTDGPIQPQEDWFPQMNRE